MDTYNLKLKIILLSIPFRNFTFIDDDYYYLYLLEKISYNQFIKEMFKLVNYEMNIKDMDEFILILKSIYSEFYNKNIIEFYMELISKLGATLLRLEHNKVYLNEMFLQTSKDLFSSFKASERIFIWYYLSRQMIVNTIIVNHLGKYKVNVNDFIDPYIKRIPVNFTNRFQDNIYREGIYETHAHFGGSIDFETQWWFMVCCQSSISNKRKIFAESEKIFQYRNNHFNYELYLLAAIAIRYLIIKMINIGISSFYHNDQNKEYIRFIDLFNKVSLNEEITLNVLDKIKIEIERKKYICNDKVDKHKSDFIETLIKEKGEICEVIFEKKCQDYIECHKNKLDTISRCYFNYLKIKNSFFSLKVEANMTKGLSYFQEFYNANRISYMSLEDKLSHVLNYYYQQKFILGIELKVPGSDSIKDVNNIIFEYKKNIVNFLNGYKKWINDNFIDCGYGYKYGMKVGFIISFKKKPINMKTTCIHDYFIYGERKNLGYGELQYSMMLNMFAIQYLRKHIPKLKDYILGIDVAGNENNTPPAVYAPVYRSVRNTLHEIVENSANIQLKEYYNEYDIFPNESIGFTFHAGEVFSSIVTSFRYIDEIAEKFNYLQSDRIGHALALAIDLKRHLRDKKITQIKKIDYLMNLIWMYSLISQVGLIINSISESNLREKIIGIAREIYMVDSSKDETISMQTLLDLYQMRFQYIDRQVEFVEKKCGKKCPFNMICRNTELDTFNKKWELSLLVASFHCKYFLKRMNESMMISESLDDYELYNQLQDYVKSKVMTRGYIVELNPVSNSVIGNIDDVTMLPYLNLFSLNSHDENDKKTLITINTDDSAIFNSNILFQYSLLTAQFSLMNFSKKDIIDWLYTAQKNSHRSTFLNNDKLTWYEIDKELDNIINELKNI